MDSSTVPNLPDILQICVKLNLQKHQMCNLYLINLLAKFLI